MNSNKVSYGDSGIHEYVRRMLFDRGLLDVDPFNHTFKPGCTEYNLLELAKRFICKGCGGAKIMPYPCDKCQKKSADFDGFYEGGS